METEAVKVTGGRQFLPCLVFCHFPDRPWSSSTFASFCPVELVDKLKEIHTLHCFLTNVLLCQRSSFPTLHNIPLKYAIHNASKQDLSLNNGKRRKKSMKEKSVAIRNGIKLHKYLLIKSSKEKVIPALGWMIHVLYSNSRN